MAVSLQFLPVLLRLMANIYSVLLFHIVFIHLSFFSGLSFLASSHRSTGCVMRVVNPGAVSKPAIGKATPRIPQRRPR